MRMIDLIEKKRDGLTLSTDEIRFFVKAYTEGSIPDYQISAMMMAIYFQGMDDGEAAALTDAMLKSGDTIDLSAIDGIKVDKHSTGGVGDKTTLVLGPLVAAGGVKLAKLSGRGLGHTGGTLDKLESIDGFDIDLSEEAFIKQVKDINLAVAGQTENLVPADKKLYALRDVTGTVPSIPLIASSIMSKKLASGADVICLDVKTGDGAFMKSLDDARHLSKVMVDIGEAFDKKITAFITRMDQPLGHMIGNRLEVYEAIRCLSKKGPEDLENLCKTIAAHMFKDAGRTKTVDDGLKLAEELLVSGKALSKFYEFVEAQHGRLDDLDDFIHVKHVIEYPAKASGTIKRIKARNIGVASMKLGGGRQTKDDTIDPMVGIELLKKVGDTVNAGEPIAKLYANGDVSDDIHSDLDDAFMISDEDIEKQDIIIDIIR